MSEMPVPSIVFHMRSGKTVTIVDPVNWTPETPGSLREPIHKFFEHYDQRDGTTVYVRPEDVEAFELRSFTPEARATIGFPRG